MIKFISNVFPKDSLEDFWQFIEGKEVLGVDTETEGFYDSNNRILLLQVGDEEEQWVIDFLSLAEKEVSLFEEKLFLTNTIKVFHNAVFDIQFLWKHGIKIKNAWCTQVAETIRWSGKDSEKGFYTLEKVAKRYCSAKLDKSTRSLIQNLGIYNQRVIHYSAEDVKYLVPIFKEQLNFLSKEGMADPENIFSIYNLIGLEMNVLYPYAWMQAKGMNVDLQKMKSIDDAILQKLDQSDDDVLEVLKGDMRLNRFVVYDNDMFNPRWSCSINFNSPIQKLKLLRTIVPDLKDTAASTLEEHAHSHEIFRLLTSKSKLIKLQTSFTGKIHSFVNPYTNRVHSSIWQSINSGRSSVSNPNYQQLPSRGIWGPQIRACYIAGEGKLLVLGDYSQQELRIAAFLSQEPVWVEAYRLNKDIHTSTAAIIFGVTESDVIKEMRDKAKTANFAIIYGGNAFTLANRLGISVSEAKSIYKAYVDKLPTLFSWLRRAAAFTKTYGFSQTAPPYSKRRYFDSTEYVSDSVLEANGRAGTNHIVQGTASHMTKLALVYCYEEMVARNFPLHTGWVVHDELDFEVDEDAAEEWKTIMETSMLKASNVILPNFPMAVDLTISKYWKK